MIIALRERHSAASIRTTFTTRSTSCFSTTTTNMPANTRIQSSASKLHNLLVPRPPTPCLLPLRSIWQPAAIHTPRSVQARLNSGLSKDWKGTGAEDNAVNRAKKNDTTDPTTDASASVMQDRKEGGGNDAKPQGATEKGGSQHGKKAKQEHPKAPEPIIGMNDERGHKGH